MRPIALSIRIAAFASGLISCASLAQTASSCGVVDQSQQFSLRNSSSMTRHSPFSATVQTTHTRKLPDGNIIHGVIVTHYYRDSAGRTRDEFPMGPCVMGPDGQFREPIHVVINDPTNQTIWDWHINDLDKIAVIDHVHRVSVEPPVLTAEQLKLQALVLKYGQDNTDGEKLRDGGIAGVSCEHFRSVTTTPAGAKGNKLPIKSTIEDCIAHDIGNLHILRVWDSALSGRTEYKFIKFTRGEPDRSLFEPPPSYTILELPIKPANAASAVSPQ